MTEIVNASAAIMTQDNNKKGILITCVFTSSGKWARDCGMEFALPPFPRAVITDNHYAVFGMNNSCH
jgi:hypothetical protein